LPNFIKWKHARKREIKRNKGQKPKSRQVNNPKGINHREIKELQTTSRFRIETMYVYYIAMEIYVLVCTNIFSPFYFLCVTIMSHHSPTMDFTRS
jgi:hypothetical protein